jgi:arylsulfatase A-like enzyme
MDHGMETKIALYENGVRIPQFIHYPAKINAGTKFDAPVSTIDIGATMMDFAGIVPSYELDGKSWKDAVGDASQELSWKNNRCLF